MSDELRVQPVAPDVYVAGQLGPEAMAWAAAQGFRSVVNNRPDFEGGPDQPANAAIEAAARAAGLSYAYQPVAPGYHSPEDIARFTQLLATLPRPLLAFCRSGARSARLFMAAAASQGPG